MIINKSIDFKNIYLLKPINISKNTIYINFKIKTELGKEAVLIQTPRLFIPFGINKYKEPFGYKAHFSFEDIFFQHISTYNFDIH